MLHNLWIDAAALAVLAGWTGLALWRGYFHWPDTGNVWRHLEPRRFWVGISCPGVLALYMGIRLAADLITAT